MSLLFMMLMSSSINSISYVRNMFWCHCDWILFSGLWIQVRFLDPWQSSSHSTLYVVDGTSLSKYDTINMSCPLAVNESAHCKHTAYTCGWETEATRSLGRPKCRWEDNNIRMDLSYGLDDRGSRVRFPAGAGNFSLHHRVQNGSGAHQASLLSNGYQVLFPWGKAAGAWSWPLTSI
jgi:hypothetical protein